MNPNKGGNCSAYTNRVALSHFGIVYEKAKAWELPEKNKVTLMRRFDRAKLSGGLKEKEILDLIREKKITPGTILGVYYLGSEHNQAGRDFTHAMVYIGVNREGKHLFWHNFSGPKRITLEQIYTQGIQKFYPVAVLKPKK